MVVNNAHCESVDQAYLDNRVADLLIRQRHDTLMEQGTIVPPGLDPRQAPPSNAPRDIDEVIQVQILSQYLVTVTSDEVWADLECLPGTSRIRMYKDIHSLRIGRGTTTPTRPLMPSEVEGLDTLSWHVGSVVEDEGGVS